MAGSVNKVILLGNLGQDPDVRTMQNGKKVCSFSNPSRTVSFDVSCVALFLTT